MPDDSSGQQPAGDAQQGSSPVKQGIVGQGSNDNPTDNGTATKNLAADVHWITHATFWSQVGLGVIGVVALWIYNGQLTEMKKATKASAQAAYAACVSAQAAQNMFTESQNSANDSHSQAVATIQEAAAEVQSERASVLFLSRPPNPGEIIGPNFGIVISLQNAGKGDARDVAIKYWAVLLKKGETLRFPEPRKEQLYLSMPNFPAGYTYPEKAEPPHGQLFLTAQVRDIQGKIVLATSRDATDLMSGGATFAYIYGKMSYSDIAGHHAEQFCHAIWVMSGNTLRSGGTTENERRCGQYIRSDEQYNYKPVVPPQISNNAVASNVTCVKPMD
ncbi:MAG: hypothetical protein ACJ71S_13035 [Acidobacteriaceae bacterium]